MLTEVSMGTAPLVSRERALRRAPGLGRLSPSRARTFAMLSSETASRHREGPLPRWLGGSQGHSGKQLT